MSASTLIILLAMAAATSAQAAVVEFDANTFGGLRARSIGPALTSGRIAAIDGVAGEVTTLYVGAASGGVWKSIDGGVLFEPVFDDYPQSIGAVRIDPAHPDTVWVGTGESWVRNSVGIGNGVYRSTDGGESWTHLGLEDSEHIAAIRIDPDHSDTVFVCALGHTWDGNEQRGVFKSDDGGTTWKRVLYVDQDTGCADLDMDPVSPNILYAALWSFRRSPDFFVSGGPGSGLYRSMDGGETWERLTRGLPEGELGRIAVAVAPSRPSTVYATVESASTALYRSDDFGTTWTRMNDSQNLQMRPFYFSELVVDPGDHRRVYKPAFTTSVSDDGGDTFSALPGRSAAVHPDHHALWINPANPNHLVLGTDGGLYVSYDRAFSWRFVRTLPVSQFYHVATDDQWPYRVYGGLQDNGSWTGPSRSPGGIVARDWDSVGFGDGFWTLPDPHDPSIVFSEFQGGRLLRIHRQLGEVKWISPVAAGEEEELRFNWNAPIHLSPSRPGTLYFGSQHLHRSRDRGESWETLSPDLTSDDPRRQRQDRTGGLTIDNSTAENNATLYTISESPRNSDLIWVGSDDGLVHLTRDAGASWRRVHIPGVPEGTWVSRVEASPHDEAVAFVTFDGHRTGDTTPYAYMTEDFGQTWSSLAGNGIDGYAWVIRQDPVNPDLLFLGTEFGLYISLDRGRNWARFKENLPPVAVHDLAFQQRENDLVIGTHGRGVYIVDDLTALRALTQEVIDQDVAILPSRDAVMVAGGPLQFFRVTDEFVGLNPPGSATITYYLRKRHLFGDLKVNVYDADDRLIATLPAGKRRGINRVDWPMRLPPPKFPAANSLVPGFIGPRVPEGEYRVELVKGDRTLESTVRLVADQRSPHSAEDRMLQQRLALEIYTDLADLTYLVESVDDLAEGARAQAATLGRSDGRRLHDFADELAEFAAALAARGDGGWLSGEERLREHLGNLYGAVSSYDGKPSETQRQRRLELRETLSEAMAAIEDRLQRDLPQVNRLLARRGLEPLARISREQWEADNRGDHSTGATSAYFRRVVLPAMNLFLQP